MYIIGITGGTASGKTSFVNQLKQHVNGSQINFLSQDDYYKPLTGLSYKDKDQINFDHPDSLDFDLLEKHIHTLKIGQPIEKPTYSFQTHDRLVKTTTTAPRPILIIEGILVLSMQNIKQLCNYTIFVAAPEDVRQQRRLKRDVAERGRTAESVLYQFETNIHPMHRQYIEPLKNKVDYIIDGTKSFETPITHVLKLIENQYIKNK
ncbi:uridine kinase [Aquimarina agarivorans]|uniref:uridine kinase n=1 Tax=Aquimarina agarivorans TaxID=980584 RepID=UPI000248F029|nr:uridine kinase [Aquimarina agarivorans]